jgi:hypothetical protein
MARRAAGPGCRLGKRLRGDDWQRVRRIVARGYGLPFNDPRLAEWTDADYLREFAFLELEATGALLDPAAAEAAEEFEKEEALAEVGDWEALGLDPPEMVPATVDELRATMKGQTDGG